MSDSLTKIAIGSDHGGFNLKLEIIEILREKGYSIIDCGCVSTESVDYPDVAVNVREAVVSGQAARAILICGTGIGMAMAVNRDVRIRAALCHDEYTARMSRAHNNANVLCLGGRVIGSGVCRAIVETWLQTEFDGGRHLKRIAKFS
ncbi:MAG: ribose 5-phosphate isomerase B [Desulfofustis sp. PB-SRB1]|mgnify:CR=1 FL=1|nr:ribose 5-phosphate isomerase B [Desulfofustis sp. PB-SRB1]MBM1003777.1 ribose 5-phosphate isomerase B [Desulfofustis sp. PB-SRB1]HBH29138.1 ribose 5-phosphate isomerase B [Desulfofustis sp.]HBH32678.1 ribose 5-phosphate isomerase B [Desulfofustis sp.]